MEQSNFRNPDNEMSKPDSFLDSFLDSLLGSLPGLTDRESRGLGDQNAVTSSEMIFSESSEMVEQMNAKNDIPSPRSESAPTATVSEFETDPPEHEENAVAPAEQIDPLSAEFFVDLACEIRSSLTQTKEHARFSEKNLPDNESSEYFCQIGNEIEMIEMLLDVYVKFHKMNTPIKKANTVHTLIEKVLKKHGNKLKEKNILLFRKFKNNLPEIIIPDKQLEYIIDHLVQYAISSISPSGGIGLFTSSRVHNENVAAGQAISHEDYQYVYISIVLTGCRGLAKQSAKKPRIQDYHQRERVFGLMMQFVEETVRKNRGMLKIEVDEEKKKTFLIMGFPIERRQVVYYDLGDE